MIKKTVTYNNLDGVEIKKDLYFHIAANDLVEKEALSDSEYSKKLKAIAETNKLSEVYPVVIEFLKDGYGVRTEDGDFEKDPTGVAWDKFRNSLAYEALMEDLLMDPTQNGNKLAEFLNAMFPESLLRQAQEQQATPGFRPGADISRPTPPVAVEQPVPVTPSEPVVEEPKFTYLENLPENGGSTTVADQSVIQTSEPREPGLSQQ